MLGKASSSSIFVTAFRSCREKDASGKDMKFFPSFPPLFSLLSLQLPTSSSAKGGIETSKLLL